MWYRGYNKCGEQIKQIKNFPISIFDVKKKLTHWILLSPLLCYWPYESLYGILTIYLIELFTNLPRWERLDNSESETENNI